MDCVSSTAEETLDTLSANQEGVTNAPSDLTVILSAATVQHSADDESEEYESANEGDTDGEAAASEEAVAASKALNVCISSSPTKMTDTSPTIDACAFTTPPGPSNQTTSPDKIENPVDYLQTQLSQTTIGDEVFSACDTRSTELQEGHPAEEVETKEAEASSTDNEREVIPVLPRTENFAGEIAQLGIGSSSEAEKRNNVSLIDSTRPVVTSKGRGDESSKTEDSTMPHSSPDDQEYEGELEKEDVVVRNWASDESADVSENPEVSDFAVTSEKESEEPESTEVLHGSPEPNESSDNHVDKAGDDADVVDGDYVLVGEEEGDENYIEERDRQHPAFIPRQGKFFMHDLRCNQAGEIDASNQNQSKVSQSKSFQREWQPNPDSRKWQHDLFPQANASSPTSTKPPLKANTIEMTAPKIVPNGTAIVTPTSQQRKRVPVQARVARNKNQNSESLYPQTYEPRAETSKKRSTRTIANSKFNSRAAKNFSTTEDEFVNNGSEMYPYSNERQPAWQKRGSNNYHTTGGSMNQNMWGYPTGGGGRRAMSHAQSNQATGQTGGYSSKYNGGGGGRAYKESDDSGYNVDEFDMSGSPYNPNFRIETCSYNVQECYDDGSRHGAFLSARRQYFRPPSYNTEKGLDTRYGKDNNGGFKKSFGSYEERTKPALEAGGSKSMDMPAGHNNDRVSDYNGKAFVKRKAQSKERESKSSYSERYSSTIERSKSVRNDVDVGTSRRGAKSRNDPSSRNRTAGSGIGSVLEVHRKDRKAMLLAERTDSSDVDHEPKEWNQPGSRRKGATGFGEQFETPPRFERSSIGSSSSTIPVDGVMASKKIGVTRPFMLNTSGPTKETNLDSDHQVGYIASEEQEVSDSPMNSSLGSVSQQTASLNKSGNSGNSVVNRTNKRYSAARRVSPSSENPSIPPFSMAPMPFSSQSNMSGANVSRVNSQMLSMAGNSSGSFSHLTNSYTSMSQTKPMSLTNSNNNNNNNNNTFYSSNFGGMPPGVPGAEVFPMQNVLASVNNMHASFNPSQTQLASGASAGNRSTVGGTGGGPSTALNAAQLAMLAATAGPHSNLQSLNQATQEQSFQQAGLNSAYSNFYGGAASLSDHSAILAAASVADSSGGVDAMNTPLPSATSLHQHQQGGNQNPGTTASSLNPSAAMYYYPAMAMAAAQAQHYISATGSGASGGALGQGATGAAGQMYPPLGPPGVMMGGGQPGAMHPQQQQQVYAVHAAAQQQQQVEQFMAAMAAFSGGHTHPQSQPQQTHSHQQTMVHPHHPHHFAPPQHQLHPSLSQHQVPHAHATTTVLGANNNSSSRAGTSNQQPHLQPPNS